jgi:chromate transporter
LGPAQFLVPELASLDWRAAVIAIAAAVLVFGLKQGLLRVLGLCALLGLMLSWV